MAESKNTVVVTGVTSFVGLHLAARFSRSGWRVVATHGRELPAYQGIQADRLEQLQGRLELRKLDITKPSECRELVERVNPSLWLHHAGFADNYGSMDYDLPRSFDVNVEPLTTLYPLLADCQASVIVTGSSAEYSDSPSLAAEADECLPATPYGLSKLTETVRAAQLSRLHGVPTRVARLFIPFGSFDNPKKLLASVIESLNSGTQIGLSDCTQARDFVGVSDLCSGYECLVEDMPRTLFDIFNLCGGAGTTLREFLIQIAETIGAETSLLDFGARTMRAGETPFSAGSNDKADRLLDWQPRPLAKAIAEDLINPADLF